MTDDNVVDLARRTGASTHEVSTEPLPRLADAPPDPKDIVLCIFHRNCLDGFGAAWAVRKAAMRDRVPVEIIDAAYGDAPPPEADIAGRHVLIVDFSYPRAALEEMARHARSVIVLDHHVTARDALVGLPEPLRYSKWERQKVGYGFARTLPDLPVGTLPLAAIFDMERSGAGLVWDFFFPFVKRPVLIDQIEDRDLWKFRFKTTRDVAACLASYPKDFGIWDQIAASLEDRVKRDMIVTAGNAINRKLQQDIASLLATTARRMKIGGHDVPVANLPPMWASEAGNILAKGEPFAATYYDRNDGKRAWSLRSSDAGLDVSEIAKMYAGGGHRNASGFATELGWEGDRDGLQRSTDEPEGR